jgi:hypothetical protein
MAKKEPLSPSGGSVAFILAISLGIAFNMFTLAVLYTAVDNDAPLSENATQVLTGWGGGIVGILGAYIGYRIGFVEASREDPSDPPATISEEKEG